MGWVRLLHPQMNHLRRILHKSFTLKYFFNVQLGDLLSEGFSRGLVPMGSLEVRGGGLVGQEPDASDRTG